MMIRTHLSLLLLTAAFPLAIPAALWADPVPQAGAPCDTCISGSTIDRKCVKDCFQMAVGEFSDGIVGEIAECGNGIVQPGEFCDDGNLVNGDCCSSTCTVEAGSPEGPMGDATCTDGLDNDCDGLIDAADPGCQ